jgi:hypothetical protein
MNYVKQDWPTALSSGTWMWKATKHRSFQSLNMPFREK